VLVALGEDEKLYELQAAGPGRFTLSRAGKCYTVSADGSGAWPCDCPSAHFRRSRRCKHAAVVADLAALFRGAP
jgi:hypothetical protein